MKMVNSMNSYVNITEIAIDNDCRQKLKILYQFYIKHEYNLLGSGYIKVGYNLVAKGFHGRKYRNCWMGLYGKNVEARLKGKCTYGYDPINWFVDYRSGFFFSPWKYSSQKKCCKVMDEKVGVDIKCPWELGRFYHLLQLAVLAVSDTSVRETIIIEFKNEIADFIETNPVGKGVQWSAPMDVSIRMVNLLLAYDILKQLDVDFLLDMRFQENFEAHIWKSLEFVMEHLEYAGRISTNHYLSNLSGIIFAAAYLSKSNWTDACLVFGVQELINQTGKQFYKEGSHFEGSTSYHRLSTEFVLYSMALILGVLKTDRKSVFAEYDSRQIQRLKPLKLQEYDLHKGTFFPEWFVDRLYNAGIFTKTILKDNYEIVQIGDNDSGRLLKLTPIMTREDKEDNVLDHRTLLSAISGLFYGDDFKRSGEELPLESSLVCSLAKYKRFNGHINVTCIEEYGSKDVAKEVYQYVKKHVLFQDDRESLLEGVQLYYFDQFGIVVLRGRRIFLSMVIDTAKNAVYLGHTHNDKLSIEVMIDGKYITRDSGEYIYTAAPGIRDRFRSTRAHNTICVEECEQNIFNGIWGMERRAKAELLYCTKNKIIAKVNYGNTKCLRDIHLTDNRIEVFDFCNKPFKVSFKNKIYSDGYGKIKRVKG